MSKESALKDFLDQHRPIAGSASIPSGTILSGWRIVAFLGRGGSAEVYRAVHVSLPLQGAVKVLMRSEPSHVERFKRETVLLAELRHLAFPRFFGSGETEGHPYIIMELLEPMDLPRKDKAVANFLMSVAEGVKALHSRRIIHRDLKPQNVMRRKDGSPVIIDFGLTKKYSPLLHRQMPPTLSIVDGKHVGLGTPRYAAPEQFSGGEITPAVDIHALGMLANECFGGRPPFVWTRIIRRCSSSIPFLRYQSVDDFVCAIKHRHWLRNAILAFAVLGALAAVAVSVIELVVTRHEEQPVVVEDPESVAWRGLTENMSTNVVELGELVSMTLTTNGFGHVYPAERVWRIVTNEINIALVRLNNVTNRFERPIHLDQDRECWIVGPGVLDAELLAPTGTMIRLENCVFLNRTRTPIDVSKLNYELNGRVYMNFPELDQPRTNFREYINDNRGANKVRFRGPDSIRALREEEEREVWRMIQLYRYSNILFFA